MSVAVMDEFSPLLCDPTGITTPEQHERIDSLEAWMLTQPPIDAPVEHFFTPDQYCRKIYMSAGSLITSKIHRTEHPFFVLQGKAAVWDGENGVQIIKAPYFGITKPGTRRVLLIAEDCVWVTVHRQDGETVEQIEQRIIEPRVYSIEQSNDFLQIKDTDIKALLSDALQKDI
jgi:hypothetical protein